MKNIIKALGFFGGLTILFSTGYFIQLYSNFTQLILSLGIAGFGIFIAFLYIYNWIMGKDEEGEERDEAMDRLNMYIREVEDRLK